MPSGISIMEFSMELLCSNVSFHSQDPKLDAFSSEWIYHSLEKRKIVKQKENHHLLYLSDECQTNIKL